MKLKLINAAIVLVGQVYNPALFSNEFVHSAKIAQKSWELVQQPITTPAISILRYDNRLKWVIERHDGIRAVRD